jgi:hypothetical protein
LRLIAHLKRSADLGCTFPRWEHQGISENEHRRGFGRFRRERKDDLPL